MSDPVPAELRYTDQHEWVREDQGVVTIGITAYAQEQLGDVVYVDLPAPGAEVQQGQAVGEVESTKSVSDLYAPVGGIVAARNEELDERPELVNQDPYGAGWLIQLTPSDPAEVAALLDAAAYRALLPG